MSFANSLKRLRGWKLIGQTVNGKEYFEHVADWVKPRARKMDLPGLYFLQGKNYLYRIEVQNTHNLSIRWRRRLKIRLPKPKLLRDWGRIGQIVNGREELGRMPIEVARRVRKMDLPGLYFFHGSHFEYQIEVRAGRNVRVWRRPKVRTAVINKLRNFRRSKWFLVILGLAIIFISIAYYPTIFGESIFASWMETPLEIFGALLILVGLLVKTHGRRLKIVRALLIILLLFTGSSYGYHRLDESGKIDEWLGRTTEEGTIGGEIAEKIPTLVDTLRGLWLEEPEPTPTLPPLRPTPTPPPTNTSKVWIGSAYLVGADGNPIILVNNPNANNPSWNQLVNFLKQDPTDNKKYDFNSFVCADFAEMLHNNAEEAGLRAAYVSIELGPSRYISGGGHALNAFQTTDRGLVYIDCTGLPSGIAGPSYRDKVVDVEVGRDYVPTSIIPEAGWQSTWENMGRVLEIEAVQW